MTVFQMVPVKDVLKNWRKRHTEFLIVYGVIFLYTSDKLIEETREKREIIQEPMGVQRFEIKNRRRDLKDRRKS